jgi:hypothetical protein
LSSVYDVAVAITKQEPKHVVQTFSRLYQQYKEFTPSSSGKVTKLRINGSGRDTPVADAATLIEIAFLLPGKVATAFRRSAAAMVCRMLGGDLTMIAEIERRHARMSATSEGAFFNGLPGQHSATTVCARSLLWDEARFDEIAMDAQNLWGSVYLVTSPSVNLVKIGSWKGTLPNLRSRYVTYYGQNIRLWAFEAEDCTATERACHQALAQYCISNELFKPENVNDYLETLNELCGECLLCPS